MAGSILIGAVASASASVISFLVARSWLRKRYREGTFDKHWEIVQVARKPQTTTGEQTVG
jgi:hypothetical protein